MAIIKQKDIYDDSKKVFTNLDKELDSLTKDTAKLTTEILALNKALRSTAKSNDGTEAKKLDTITTKLTRTTIKYKDTLTATDAVKKQILKENAKLAQSRTKEAKQLALVRQETLKNNKANRDNAKSALGMRKGLSGLSKSLIGSLGVVGGMMAFVSVLKNAFKISVTFGKESSRLASILNKTKGEISSLTDQAKDLGATTAFTASEVIKLQTELAKLGFSVTSIEAMTEGVLNLAAATGTDLASAAELVGSTLKIFNLSASESSRVADVLAKSTTISSLSMEKLATILPTVGKTAEIAGLSLEQTAALAGTLTDRGLDASSAATSLRNIFLELSKQGITWNDAMKQINESTDKNKTSMDLFGKRAASAGVILSETAEDTDNLTMALNDANGAAQEMADTMLDNLAGDMTKASSAWEGFVLSLSDGTGTLSTAFRTVTQGVTAFLGGLVKLNSEGFGTKLKVMANGILSVVNTISFGGLDKALKNVTQSEEAWRFDTDKQTGALKIQKTEIKENNKEVNNNTKDVDKNTVAVKKNTRAKKESREETGQRGEQEIGSGQTFTRDDPFALSLGLEKAFLDDSQRLKDDAAATSKRKAIQNEKDIAAARKAIADAAATAIVQIAVDIFAAGQEAKLAKLQQDNEIESTEIQAKAEADKEAQRQQLEQGLITEAEFKAASIAIDEEAREKEKALDLKFRIAQAKAAKRAALFQIGIDTAVAIIKVTAQTGILAPFAIPALLAVAAIQAAAVIAKPLPKFAEGEVNIKGLSHEKGGINANIEGGESVITKLGTSNAPDTLDAINKGLISDNDIAMSKNYNNYDRSILQMNGLINKFDENNELTRQSNKYLRNSYSTYTNNGKIYRLDSNGKMSEIIIKDA